jgi:hypothetical protein
MTTFQADRASTQYVDGASARFTYRIGQSCTSDDRKDSPLRVHCTQKGNT